MTEDDKWEEWIQNEVRDTHHFSVHYSLKKYAALGGDLLSDLANTSTEVFGYCFRENSSQNFLVSSGWEKVGKRYRFVKGKTEIDKRSFYNQNHTVVFVVDPIAFNLHDFFVSCSVPYIVNNVATGMVKNAWSFSRSTALKKDKLVFCKVNSTPPSFTIVGGEKSIISALEVSLYETSKIET